METVTIPTLDLAGRYSLDPKQEEEFVKFIEARAKRAGYRYNRSENFFTDLFSEGFVDDSHHEYLQAIRRKGRG